MIGQLPMKSPPPVDRDTSSCDKPCGGGQQSRDKVCLGSDGLKYPAYLCPAMTSTVETQSCNTVACDLPDVPSNVSFGLDMDMRPDWVDITVTANLPTGATALQLRLGSPSGAILDTVVDEVLENECRLSYCTLQAQVQLPSYVDRLLVVAKNADGVGNATGDEGIFTDRIGQTGPFQKFLSDVYSDEPW
eukprot:Skav227360  [mRNA]  locus=scaffold1121:78593:81276:- [translate_table: standard]